MKVSILVCALLAVCSDARKVFNVTSGCGKSPLAQPGKKTHGTVTYVDPVVNREITRDYYVYIPEGYHVSRKTPVLLVYHGWGAAYHNFRQGYHPVGNPDQYITMYLKGESDYPQRGNWNSWNCGNAGDLQSCTAEAEGTCYDSCNQIGKCSRCNSYTCVDDALFTTKVLEAIIEGACVDQDRLYATGFSNGGQYIYEVVADLDVFAAVLPTMGTPFVGHVRAPNHVQNTALLHFHSRDDKTIPIDGSVSEEFWVYTSMAIITRTWADVHSCSTEEATFPTPYDGQNGLTCTRFTCPWSNSIVKCIIDGGHMAWPSFIYDLTWWYLSKFTRTD